MARATSFISAMKAASAARRAAASGARESLKDGSWRALWRERRAQKVAAMFGQPEAGPQQGLRGGGPSATTTLGRMTSSSASSQGRQGAHFDTLGLLGGPSLAAPDVSATLYRVREIDVAFGDAGMASALRTAGRPGRRRTAIFVLDVAGLFAHEHRLGARRAFAETCPVAMCEAVAGLIRDSAPQPAVSFLRRASPVEISRPRVAACSRGRGLGAHARWIQYSSAS